MQPTITFFNRSGRLYLRISLGESNKKYERSCNIDIGVLQVEKHRTEGGYICRVEGYSRPAVKANAFIQKWEGIFGGASSPEEAIMMWESGQGLEVKSQLMFTALMQQYIREASVAKDWAYPTIKNFTNVLEKYKDYCSGDDFNVYAHDIKSLKPVERRPVIKSMKDRWHGFAGYLKHECESSSGTIYLYFTKIAQVIKYANDEYGIEIPMPYRPKSVNYEDYKVDWPDWVTYKLLALPNEGFYPVFKAQVWTTLRISDMFSLSIKNFENFSVNNETFWVVTNVNSKTKMPVSPVLPEGVALSLLANIEKYGHVVPSDATNLSTYNRQLKWAVERVAKESKITIVTDEGVEHVPIYETASSHQLRKEGINLYERAGFDSGRIRRLFSGHKSEATYDKHYRNPLREDALIPFAEFQRQFTADRQHQKPYEEL